MNDLKPIEERLFAEVQAEMQRQVEKWGVQTHSPIVWSAILTEETGEVAKAVLENWYQGKTPVEAEYRKELIQVAAVAISALRSLEITSRLPDEEYEKLRPQINEHVAAELEKMQTDGAAPPTIQPATPNEASAQQGIQPTLYGEGKSIDPNLGAMLIRQQAASRLLDAAVAAIELVTAQHKNVKIALPAPMSATRLSFQAERFSPQLNGWEPLSGQEDFAHELRTCKNDAELILAIAKRIESEMELPPIIRGVDGK